MRIKLLAILITLGLIVGCGKDDDESGSYFGTWVATNIEITGCDDVTNDDFQSIQCSDNNCFKLVLEAEGTYAFQEGLNTEFGTWSVDGSILTFCIEDEGEQTCRTFEGIVSAAFLRLSQTSEDDGCTTSYIMERRDEEEADDEGEDEG